MQWKNEIGARTYSVALFDGKARLIAVQCKIINGVTAFRVSGLPIEAASAIKSRARTALNSMGLSLPAKYIEIAVPFDYQTTECAHLDLPIAVSLLAAMNLIPRDEAERRVCLGGLSEGGELISVDGALPATITAAEENLGLICPNECAAEAAWVGSVQVVAPKSLLELINHFNGRRVLPTVEFDKQHYSELCLSEPEIADGRTFLTVCNTRCLNMDGQIYPITTRNHEFFYS